MAENLLDEASAKSTLKGACESLSTIRRGLPGIAAPEQHLLTPAYGVSPTAAAIVQFSRDKQMDLLVVGASDRPSSDIFQATKLAVGFKSISDYCIANASCSVLAVRRGTQAGLDAAKPSLQPSPGEAPGAKRQICVICDGSRLLRDMSAGMLRWVLQHLYSKDSDQLHIITIEAEQSSKRVPRGLRDPPNRTVKPRHDSRRSSSPSPRGSIPPAAEPCFP